MGLIAFWSGVDGGRIEMTTTDFRAAFRLATLPPEPVVFTAEDHAWLLARV